MKLNKKSNLRFINISNTNQCTYVRQTSCSSSLLRQKLQRIWRLGILGKMVRKHRPQMIQKSKHSIHLSSVVCLFCRHLCTRWKRLYIVFAKQQQEKLKNIFKLDGLFLHQMLALKLEFLFN